MDPITITAIGVTALAEAGFFGEVLAATTGFAIGVGEFIGDVALTVAATTPSAVSETAVFVAQQTGGAVARVGLVAGVSGTIHEGKVIVDKAGNFLSFAEPEEQSGGVDDKLLPPPPDTGEKGETPHKIIVPFAEYVRIQHRKHRLLPTAMPGKRHKNGIPYTRTVVQRFSTNEANMNQPGTDATVGLWIYANALENPFQVTDITSNALLFDQLVKIYERYYVKKATLRVDFFNDSTTEGQVVGLSIKDDKTILSSTGQYVENGETVYRTLTPKEHSQLVLTVKPPSFFGSKHPGSDDRLQVTATGGDAADARPSDELLFHMWTCPIDGANTVSTTKVRCFITIEYEVVWSQPRAMDRSTAT